MLTRHAIELSVLMLLIIPAVAHAQDNEACLECHGDRSLLEDADSKRLYVDSEIFENSVHGAFLSCVDCHADLAGEDPAGHDPDLAPVKCGACHDDVATEYAGSLHAYARQHGNTRAPNCSGCHGTHDILPSSDEGSPSNRKNIVQMCGACHGSAGLLTDKLVRLPEAVQGYARSVHGQAFRRGIETAAVCVDCHGSHSMKGVLDPESKINPVNVSKTCGRCHSVIEAQYDQSIHGRALAAGIVDSPTCNTCHGEHQILSPKDANAATAAGHQAIQTCGRCHEDSRIISKYGLADYVVETYVDSYHGWAKRWDSPNAATCVRCHTAHWVLPARDPASTISPRNVVETCRQCHEDADQAFAVSYTHKTAAPAANPVTNWLRWTYLLLIPAVIGGMLLHNSLIVGYYLQKRRREQELIGTVRRLDRQQLIQHTLLALSFVVLVITGFALRFPDAFWVRPLVLVGMDEAIRSVVHRIAAVVLLVTGFLHVLYVIRSRHGREEFSALIPKWRDVQDAVGSIAFYLGIRREKPSFEQYDYTQKAEYWALVWGTVVMALTGFVLWFPETAVDIFPTWIVEASQMLHYYEAWLATLAILVWHFFFVIFHPDVYPMSWTWLTGRMDAHEAEEHHGDWYDRVNEDEE
jgi:formate dehydrogenase gamma subunit